MILRLLQLLLILAVVRAVWRLAKGVLEGAGYPARRRAARRSGVKLERDPVCGTYVSPAKAPGAAHRRRRRCISARTSAGASGSAGDAPRRLR